MALYFETKARADQIAEDMSEFFVVEISFDGQVYTLILKEI